MFDHQTVSLYLAAVVSTFFSYFILRGRTDPASYTYTGVAIAVAVWALLLQWFIVTPDLNTALIISNIHYTISASIPLFFFYFTLLFPYHQRKLRTSDFLYALPIILWATALVLIPNLLIEKIYFIGSGNLKNVVLNQYIYFPYTLYFVFFIGAAYLNLYNSYRSANDEQKHQVRIILLGTIVSYAVGLIFNLILPWLGNYSYIWIGPLAAFALVISSGYAMIRYNLFDVKTIATEALVIVMWGFVLTRAIISTSFEDQLADGGLLVVLIIIGILLIRSVYREVETRKEIEILAEGLKQANDKLTELDKLKSQFLSIATHELRTPLTIVRNFIALILDGTYGKVPPAVEEGGRQVFERVTDMAHSVDTYLNVSRIEQGKIKYEFAPEDLTKLVTTAFSGMKANADKKGLQLSLTIGKSAELMRGAFDAPKITEVLINLLDNSIKYTPKGSITATLERIAPQRARLTIKDTGVGMSQKTMQNLFKLFSPGEDAKKVNPASTGVGLYVSRAHAEAHKGSLTASSAGEGKGSQFILELPIS